jgi:hypothetical protein
MKDLHAMRIGRGIIVLSIGLSLLWPLAVTASAQSTGTPVTASGQPALSGSPYVKTHKRHDRLMYGKHYNPEKFSKR